MDLGLEGKVAAITGGGSGIGRATALMFAAEGSYVAVADLFADRAAAVASEIGAAGGRALPVQVDVAQASSVMAAVQAIVAAWGRIDVLVNCAGIYQRGTIEDIGERDWDHVLDVNLKGTFLFCKFVVPVMARNGGGAIVNVSSISGRTKSDLAAVNYVASKAGVIGLTMCLASQLAPKGIRVNCVAPGTIDTPMNADIPPEGREVLLRRCPMGRFGRPEEVAAAILFLASPLASYITGETLNVNGGVFMV